MKNLLKKHYLENSCRNFKAQPEGVKKIIIQSFEEEYNGVIDYIDYFGEPMIFSKKEMEFYIFRDGSLQKTGTKNENDLERLDLQEFNNRFNGIGDKLSKEFKDKAKIENYLEIILEPKDLEEWLISLLEDFDEDEKKLILEALNLCKKQHKGQYRNEGVEYYSHPIFVAIKGIEKRLNYKDIIILLLHDIIEDSSISKEEIGALFGEEVANNIYLLSKKENGKKIINTKDYYIRIANNEKLAILKGLDRLSNLYSLNFASKEKQKKYIKETREILVPIIFQFDKYLAEEIKQILSYIENELHSLPGEVKSKLSDLQKIKNIKDNLITL